jgi:hypothetical protein
VGGAARWLKNEKLPIKPPRASLSEREGDLIGSFAGMRPTLDAKIVTRQRVCMPLCMRHANLKATEK